MLTEHIAEIRVGKKFAQPQYEISYRWDDETSGTVILPPGIPTKGELVNAFVRDRYSSDRMESVTNNYMLNLGDMGYAADFIAMQRWRGVSKVMACEALLVIMDGLEEFDRLETVRSLVTQQVNNHDMSDSVNAFLIDGQKYWMPKPMRESLVMTLQEYQKAGISLFPFELDGIPFEMPCSVVWAMVTQVEVYATQCMAVTKRHLINVSGLETEEGLLEYDYKQGYPDMPLFNIATP